MKQSRLDQLSDGIFAIVMTILVFEIRVPEFMGIVNEKTLIHSLIILSPLLLSYLLSFSLLFTYWRSHHIIASVLAKNIDVQFTNLSGIFLFLVALVPFSSHFLGSYIYLKTAVILFALNIILIGISLYAMRQYAIKSETIANTPFTRKENEHANMHILFPLFASILAIVISFYSTKIAILLFTLAILFNLSKNGTKYMFYLVDIFRNNTPDTEIIKESN
ncbi:MAG: TMEM175 family protein [Candidatus Nomurabacteria bacterium]|nr:TMEM175 family protein [Candidatus Nomurabacteria bacterium]